MKDEKRPAPELPGTEKKDYFSGIRPLLGWLLPEPERDPPPPPPKDGEG
jgi:hypothetical protein